MQNSIENMWKILNTCFHTVFKIWHISLSLSLILTVVLSAQCWQPASVFRPNGMWREVRCLRRQAAESRIAYVRILKVNESQLLDRDSWRISFAESECMRPTVGLKSKDKPNGTKGFRIHLAVKSGKSLLTYGKVFVNRALHRQRAQHRHDVWIKK